MKRTVFILTALLLVVLLLGEACAQPTPAPAPEKTLQIGSIRCLTGFLTPTDIPNANETQICAELINEQGGITIQGQQYLIELIVEDSKSSMDGVTAAATRLVYDKEVKFIIGPLAFFSSAAGPVTDPAKVIRVIDWCCNTPGEMDASTPYGFLGTNASVESAIAAAKYIKASYPSVKKIALVCPDDGSIPFIAPAVEKLLEAEGLTVVGDIIAYPNDMVDFSPVAVQINAIQEADAAFHVNGAAPHAGAIVKGLRELGNTMPYASSQSSSLNQIVTVAGLEATKDVFTVSTSPDDPNIPPLAKEIIDRTIAKYGADYSLNLLGADALYILKEVIEAAQSLDTTVVKEKWESLDTVETIFGTGTVGGDLTYGISHHAVAHPQAIQILKDGVVTSGGWIDIGIIP